MTDFVHVTQVCVIPCGMQDVIGFGLHRYMQISTNTLKIHLHLCVRNTWPSSSKEL